MSTKKATENEYKLLQALDIKGKISTDEACKLLNVSLSTVRRIFTRLEENGDVLRTFGGISKIAAKDNNYSFNELITLQIAQKKSIAQAAVLQIHEHDIIYLDAGTTISALAFEISEFISQQKLSDIIIFTNSLVNLNCLAEVCTVNLIGGKFRPNRKDFCGYIAEEAIKCLHFTKCFLGADAFDATSGFTTTDFDTARLNSLVVSVSDFSYILMDSSKFGRASFVKFCDITKLSMLFTDDTPDNTSNQTIKNSECKLIITK